MGKPAARLLDMTAHGGTIVMGWPTVLIGGMPAARLTDMHVCPMVNPAGPVPVPHVGGPIFMIGSPTVLIGGLPAARVGDMAICVGPPDVIVMGCFTVLIGEAGGGAGGAGGGAGGGGAAGSPGADAIISVGIAMTAGGPGGETGAGGQGAPGEESEVESEQAHWIKFKFVDKAGNSISAVQYEFTMPDGKVREGRLGGDGQLQWSGPDAGQGVVKLMYIANARWSTDKASVGEKVKLTADVEGYDPGTPAVFHIYSRDVRGADKLMAKIETQTQGDKVETEWEYVYQAPGSSQGSAEPRLGYSYPEYYFEVTVKRSKARSGLLQYKDSMKIELKDEDGNPIPDQDYILYLSNGEVRKGKLDGSGYKEEKDVPPVPGSVRFPKLPGFEDVE